jgi:hypothetical protein
MGRISSKTEAARVEVVRSRAQDLPDRLGSVARDWIADRRFGEQDRIAVQIGFAVDMETIAAMHYAAEGTLDPVSRRLWRWLRERTDPTAEPQRAASLHADFIAWATREGLPPLGLAAFARRLRGLGIEACLHSRTRQSQFRLGLRPSLTSAGELS